MLLFGIKFFGLGLLECLGNIGIAHGLTLLVLILLCPVTNPLLRPKYRVLVWMVACVMGWTWSFYSLAGLIHVLPVTFRGWIVGDTLRRDIPAYIPELAGAGEKVFTLPTGTEIPFVMTEAMSTALAVGSFVSLAVVIWLMGRKEKEVKRLLRETQPMSEQWHWEHGIDPGAVTVRIAEGLPASFVCRVRMGYHDICLQKELPREQMELVLHHELSHIKHNHVWFKGILLGLLGFYWWSPVMWIAYRLACRDMELACDEAVLKELDETRRRDYARTLVELGSGKFLWGTVASFGECDTALRVKRAVAWKKAPEIVEGLSVLLLLGLFLFFYTGEGDWGQNDVFVPAENLVEAEKSWDGDNTVWQDYVAGPKLISDLQEFLDRPALSLAYGYEAAEGEIFTISYLGDRLHCTFIRDAEGVWQPEACEYLSKQEWNTDGLPHLKHWTTHR